MNFMRDRSSKIPYVNLNKQWINERDELLPIIDKVLESAQLVGGQELERFEKNIARACGTKYACALTVKIK